jgi:hypothetical protein
MPPEHEARSRAFYDHEQDEPRGRRRHAVADWGVSEDVFDRMPGPRFSRRGEEPRRREDAPRARFVRVEDDQPRAQDDPPEVDEWLDEAVYEDAQPVSRTIVIEREPALDAELEGEPGLAIARDDEEYALRAEYEPRGHVAPNGRRTIVIGGRPDRLPVPRTRPPRTAVERIGPRPDRILGYAVAMGVLLILIAILTSS